MIFDPAKAYQVIDDKNDEIERVVVKKPIQVSTVRNIEKDTIIKSITNDYTEPAIIPKVVKSVAATVPLESRTSTGYVAKREYV